MQPVRRTYARPKAPASSSLSAAPLPDDDLPAGNAEWPGLRTGKHADWRAEIEDRSSDDDAEEDAYERVKRALQRETTDAALSSSLPPLTSDDPLTLHDEDGVREDGTQNTARMEEEEEETAPIRPRRRIVKPSTEDDVSPSSSSSSSTRTKTPTSTSVYRSRDHASDHDEDDPPDVVLPSSQPEYQRQLALARDKGERKRALRAAAEEEEDDAGPDGGGLQTSPASPSVRKGTQKRRRRVVVGSDEEEEGEEEEGSEPDGSGSVNGGEPTPVRTPSRRRRRRRRTITTMNDDASSPLPTAATTTDVGKDKDRAEEEEGNLDEVPEHEADSPIRERTTRRRKSGVNAGSSADEVEEEKKKPRIKGLSKKEKELMNKETAQMRAGKEVHLSRIRKEFTIASFITSSIPSLATKFPFKPISQVSGVLPPLVPSAAARSIDDIPTQSSAVVPTPDSDIGQYSSQQGHRSSDFVEREGDGEAVTPTKGSVIRLVPAVAAMGKSKPVGEVLVLGSAAADSDDDDDDDGLGALKKMEARAAQKQEQVNRRIEFEGRQKALKARKEAALRAQQQQQVGRTSTTAAAAAGGHGSGMVRPTLKPARPDSFLKGVSKALPPARGVALDNTDGDDDDDDDDLVILDKPELKAGPGKAKVERLNPREMLEVKREGGAHAGGKGRIGGGVLHFAPRPETMTESMFTHAGKTFDQAGKRQREGKAKSTADTKLSRITDQQSLAFLLDRQKKLAAAEREKKERESGLKIRALQPRTERLVDEETLEETRKAEKQRMGMGMDIVDEGNASGDEDDSEDEDFAPVAADEDGSEEEADDARGLLVEETQVGEEAPQDRIRTPERDIANPLLTSAMGAVDSIEQETNDEALRQRKRKRLAIVDSDDEENAPPTLSSLVRPVEFGSEGVPESSLAKASQHSGAAGASLALGGFDDFGDGFGDSGGLSQFFNATQAPGTGIASATEGKGTGNGLDALRQGTPATVNLPGFIVPVISATAQARDMAIMREEEEDSHTGYTPRPQKKQYLNTQGLFTQTTPKMNALQGQDSMVSVDEESLPFLKDDLMSSGELEPTYQSNGILSNRATSEGFLEEASTPVAPLSRLKRRREEEEGDDDEDAAPGPPEDSETDIPLLGTTDEDEDVAFPSSQPEQPLPAETKKLDILQKMMATARSPLKPEKTRRFEGMAKEFLEAEAELDLEEDNGFFSKLDDEDDDAEGDGVVENLVDDTERSKAQELIDAERRAEIDREYAEQEDARRQKIAQEVIEGKHKGRRRDGLDGVLSSDDEDDEDKRKAKRRWRELQKKRTIGQDLSELAQGETQAFVQAYQGGLASDDSDDEVEASQSQPVSEGEEAKDDDEMEDAPTTRNMKPIAIREIEDHVRRLARQTREREEVLEKEPIDVESPKMVYVDSDTDQEESQITISRRRDDQRSVRKDSDNKDQKYKRWAATSDVTDSRRVGANSSVTGGGGNNSLGRTSSTSHRSGSFVTSHVAGGGKKGDKTALKARTSAVMGGVMAKNSGFTDSR